MALMDEREQDTVYEEDESFYQVRALREIITVGGHSNSGGFQNIDPLPPHRPASVYLPPPCLWCGGRTHSLGGEGGGGSIFWKTPDTALYSTDVSTLWVRALNKNKLSRPPVSLWSKQGCESRRQTFSWISRPRFRKI